MRRHDVWFKPTADRLARDYRAMGWVVTVYTRPKNQGYTVEASPRGG